MPTISHLIRCALDEGRTVRQLEHDSGYKVRFQTFQDLSNKKPLQFPKDLKTIEGMALALRVSQTAVVLAYAESLGIPLDLPSNFALRLPSNIDAIETDMQNALLAVVRAATKSGRVGGKQSQEDTPAPGDWRRPGKKPRVFRPHDRKQGDQGGG